MKIVATASAILALVAGAAFADSPAPNAATPASVHSIQVPAGSVYSAKDLQRMNLAKNTLVSESGKVVRVAASAIYSPKELHRLSLSGNSTVTVASFPSSGQVYVPHGNR